MSSSRFLFVVTYGRSGSTLLQGVLNSIDGYSICGENNLSLQHLFRFYLDMKSSIDSFQYNSMSVDVRNSWYQTCNVEKLKDSLYNLVFNMFSSSIHDRVVGCKEIRWKSLIGQSRGGLESFLDWLFLVLDARFIFLSRSHSEVCRSKWYQNKPVDVCKKGLEEFEDWIGSYIARHPSQDWFWLDIGELHPRSSVKAGRFRDLFVWLGEDFDFDRVSDVLSVEWGY